MSTLKPTPEAEKLLHEFAAVAHELTAVMKPMEAVMALQDASYHLLAQQLAFCSTKVPTARARQAYLTSSLEKLAVLIRQYETGIKRGKNEKVR